MYCEFYSEQKNLPESSIVRKSIRKKKKVLREIFSAAKIEQKKQSVIIYIQYTKRKTRSCASGETGREGERVGRRSTAFPKCRLPKGDAEPQVIIFIKMQKKLSIDARGGTIESFFLQKIKKIRKMQPSARVVSISLLPGAGHSICWCIVKQAVVFLLQSLDHVVGVFVVGRRDA